MSNINPAHVISIMWHCIGLFGMFYIHRTGCVVPNHYCMLVCVICTHVVRTVQPRRKDASLFGMLFVLDEVVLFYLHE